MWMGFSHLCMSNDSSSNSFWILAHSVLSVTPVFSLTQIKVQRSEFDLETTSHDTVGISRLRDMELCIMREELVTRTGFEPMLKA